MEYPKISIITPSFNQGRYIEQTIRSVLEQHYPNLEYIIIDGGSTDETVDIIKKYADLITFWVSEPDKGQSDAINKGFQKSSGEIINWLNSDDYMAPGALQKISSAFNDPETMAVTTTVHNFEESGEEWDELTPVSLSTTEYISRSFNNQPGTFFRRDVWQKYFPLPSQLKYTMDQYLWFCFWMTHGLHQFKTKTFTSVYFRRHAQSKTSGSLNEIIFNKLGKVFFNEHNLIFWSYFMKGSPEKASIVSEYFHEGYDFRLNRIGFPEGIKYDESAALLFNQYLFELLKEDYRHGFLERFNRNLNFLETSFLSDDEKNILKKMRVKSIHPGLIRAYRSVYWKMKKLMEKE